MKLVLNILIPMMFTLSLFAVDERVVKLGFVDLVENGFEEPCIKKVSPRWVTDLNCRQSRKFDLYERPDISSKKVGYLEIQAFAERKEKLVNGKMTPYQFCHGADWVRTDGKRIAFKFDERLHNNQTYFHTFIDCKDNWYKLPKNPFDQSVWVKHTNKYCEAQQNFLKGNSILLPHGITAVEIKAGISKTIEGEKIWEKVENGFVILSDLPVTLPLDENVDSQMSETLPQVQTWKNKITERLERQVGRSLTDEERVKVLHSAKLHAVEELRLNPGSSKYKLKIEDLLSKDFHAIFRPVNSSYKGCLSTENAE